MKILLFILLTSFLMMSCKEEKYKIAADICEFIAENPEVLYKLEDKFSQIYNDSIISPDLKNIEYLNELYDTYYKVFQKSTSGSKIYFAYDHPDIESIYKSTREFHKHRNPKIDYYEFDEIFSCVLVKGDFAFHTSFGIKNNQMYLLLIDNSGHNLF